MNFILIEDEIFSFLEAMSLSQPSLENTTIIMDEKKEIASDSIPNPIFILDFSENKIGKINSLVKKKFLKYKTF